MRVLGVTMAGMLALMASNPADAATTARQSSARPDRMATISAIVRVGDGSGSRWHHSMTANRGGVDHSVPGHIGQWKGGQWKGVWWSPYSVPAVPTYWVWGPGGGAFDYPFADWRGPDGGWGNP